jgi:hypothetical protein
MKENRLTGSPADHSPAGPFFSSSSHFKFEASAVAAAAAESLTSRVGRMSMRAQNSFRADELLKERESCAQNSRRFSPRDFPALERSYSVCRPPATLGRCTVRRCRLCSDVPRPLLYSRWPMRLCVRVREEEGRVSQGDHQDRAGPGLPALVVSLVTTSLAKSRAQFRHATTETVARFVDVLRKSVRRLADGNADRPAHVVVEIDRHMQAAFLSAARRLAPTSRVLARPRPTIEHFRPRALSSPTAGRRVSEPLEPHRAAPIKRVVHAIESRVRIICSD